MSACSTLCIRGSVVYAHCFLYGLHLREGLELQHSGYDYTVANTVSWEIQDRATTVHERLIYPERDQDAALPLFTFMLSRSLEVFEALLSS